MLPSPLLSRPDAAAGPQGDPDSGVPAHYGDPLREQAALAQGRALSALARDVVTVTGPDRLTWLTTLSSQVLTGLAPGDGGVETLLMDAQGHITYALAALDDGQRLLLVSEAGRGEELAGFLESMRFMLRVEVAVAEDLAVLGALGEGVARLEAAARAVPAVPAVPAAPGGAGATGGSAARGGATGGSSAGGATTGAEASSSPGPSCWLGTWRDPWPGVVEGGTSYDVGLEDRTHPGAGYRAGWVVVPAASVPDVVRALEGGTAGRTAEEAARGTAGRAGEAAGEARGKDAAGGNEQGHGRAGGVGAPGPGGRTAGPGGRTARPGVLAGSLAWEALRVEAGRPRQAREADARAIPHELDWLRTAVHLTKGCYPGQETVARTLNLGRPPRRLTILQLDGLGGDLPAPGATVRMGERAVGAVTSVARHYELGPMALALLRRGVSVAEPLTVAVTEAGRGAGWGAGQGTGQDGRSVDDGEAGRQGRQQAGQDGELSQQADRGEPPGLGHPAEEAREVGRVAAAQEPLVSPEGRAQASPAERPGAGLRGAGVRGPGARGADLRGRSSR